MVSIAVLGFGTVGSGVAEVLEKNAASIAKKAGEEITIKYILTTHDHPESPFGGLIIHDFAQIEQDPEVQVVVECIGGVGDALQYARRALRAGKHFVTSNKELVAEYGYELLQIARENDLNFLFEASVGGGIPIIRPLTSCLAANELTEICGILNGTTNYILTKMIREGLAFDTVLKEAQEKGYAEADPTADIEGHDTCRKICILAALSFGRHVYPRQVPTEGITKVTADDVAFAMAAGKRIKLLGRAQRQEDGRICVYVAPHFVAEDDQLANVEDVFNGIVVKGDAIGDVMFYGRGAGKLPTASAVVADVIDAVKHFGAKKFVDWADGGDDVVADAAALPMRWFIRTDESEMRIGASFGQVEMIPADVPGQKGFLTGFLPRSAVDERVGSGFHAISVIPVLD
jgi:homoserine dehydrogenase